MEKKPKGKGYLAPTLCALLVIAFAAVYLCLGLAGVFAGMPVYLAALFILVPAAVLFGIIYCLLERFKEIRGGEEDDSRNY